MTNKLNETEVQMMIRTTTSVIAALGQYFDPAFTKVADALCAEHNLESLDRALCIDGALVMLPQDMVADGFNWVAVDPNGDIYAYKGEPSFRECTCGQCGGDGAWGLSVEATEGEGIAVRFLRTINPVSNATAKDHLYFIGVAN